MAEGSFHSIKYIFAKCHACMSKNRNILGICLFKSKSTFWKTIFRQISYSPSKTHLQALHCRLPILKKIILLSEHQSPSFWTGKTSLPLLEILPTTTGNFPYKNWENSLYLIRKFPDLNNEIPYLNSVS